MANVVEGAKKFRGAMVALVTPLNKNLSVDYKCLEELIEFQIRNHIRVIVPCGTTGESATLSPKAHDKVVEKTVEYANGRVFVLAGAGSNSTDEAIARTLHARKSGADGALLIEPYYNKPQNPVRDYFIPVAMANEGFPLVAYHVPGRTGGKLPLSDVIKLSKIPEYVGIKEATGDVSRAIDIIHHCGNDLPVFSGEDLLNYVLYCAGAKGAISVTANVAPDKVAAVWSYFKEGASVGAWQTQEKLYELNKAMFISGNPGSVKTALYLMGMIQPYARLPVSLAEGDARDTIRGALLSTGIEVVNK